MIVPIIHEQYILIININNNYLIILNIRNYKNYSKFLTAGDCSPLNEIPGTGREPAADADENFYRQIWLVHI